MSSFREIVTGMLGCSIYRVVLSSVALMAWLSSAATPKAMPIMMYQACHLHPIVGGNVARTVNKTLADRLVTDDLEQQRRQLVENNVKYIVIHWPSGGLFRWSPEDGQTAQYMKTYPVLYEGGEATVLKEY